MSAVIYMRIGGFKIAQNKSTKASKYQFKIVNNNSGKTTKHLFNSEEADNLHKCYHINLNDYLHHTFSIFLYKKKTFGKKLIGRVDVPTYQLPMDKVTINYLPMMSEKYNNVPAVLRITLHLTTHQNAYKAKLVPSVLNQADVADINFKLELSDEEQVNSPLL